VRPLVLLACAPAWASTPAIVGVVEAGSCPNASAVVGAIAGLLDVSGRAAAVDRPEAEYLLTVREVDRAEGALQVELRALDGRELIARSLAVEGASCAGRARSIAVVVQRYLEALSVPPAGLRRASDPPAPPTLAPPPARPTPAAAPMQVELRAGYSRDTQFDAATDQGVALDVAVRPWRRLGARAGGRVHAQRSTSAGAGEVHASRHEVHLAIATSWSRDRIGLEGGLGGRLDMTFVTTERLERDGQDRLSPAGLLFSGASVRVFRGGHVFATAEYYVHSRTASFEVAGVGAIERVTRTGLAFTFGAGWRVR
jgi:hypothetical protein